MLNEIDSEMIQEILRLSDITKEYKRIKKRKWTEAAPLPAEVKRYMSKFTDSLKGAGLNRMKQAQVLAGVINFLKKNLWINTESKGNVMSDSTYKE